MNAVTSPLDTASVAQSLPAPAPELASPERQRERQPAALSLHELDVLAAPAETERRWRAIEAQCPDASPFVCWPWVHAWLLCYGPQLHPRLVTLYRGERPIGAALVSKRSLWRHKIFHVRQLCLNTAGEQTSPVWVEFNRFLIAPDERAAAVPALLDHLWRDPQWDELLLDGFLSTDLSADLPASAALREVRRRPCYAMDLRVLRRQGCPPEQALSSNTRQQFRRSLRLFGGREQLVLEEARSAAEAQEFLGEMADLHQASWGVRGQPGVFAEGRLLRFFNLLIGTGHPGSVQLLRLRRIAGSRDGGNDPGRGQTLGISFNLLDGDTVYYYQSGLQRFPDPRCKPGLCLHLLAMEHALAAGRSRYDFMASDKRYKQSLSNTQRSMVWAVIERPRLRLLLERLALRAVAHLRSVRTPTGLTP